MNIKLNNRFLKSGLCAFVVWAASLSVASAEDVSLFVAPDGDGGNSGTMESPLSSIAETRDRIRAMKADGLTGDVVVWVRGGRYEIESPIVFTALDSGHDTLSISYKAWPGEEAVVSGGKILQGTWKKHAGDIWALDMPAVRDQQWWFRDGCNRESCHFRPLSRASAPSPKSSVSPRKRKAGRQHAGNAST